LAAAAASPSKRLKTLQIEGDAAPEAGVTVTRDGEDVGTVTSPVVSPRFGTIALAVLVAGVSNDGEKVEVDGAVATVAPLSIFDPEKRRPRV
jgi:glycine cleavage system aminomethyltransferase T